MRAWYEKGQEPLLLDVLPMCNVTIFVTEVVGKAATNTMMLTDHAMMMQSI